MRVYHFLNKKYGLENIEKHRLKISTISEINDPFEALGFNISDKKVRRNLLEIKRNISEKYGIICFSKNKSNPVQWSHYADRHKGVCLGFDVPDKHLFKVDYSSTRLSEHLDNVKNFNGLSKNVIKDLLSIKYYHWKYEQEVRWLVALKNVSFDKIYFIKFSDDLILKQVIIGSRSSISRKEILKVLNGYKSDIEVYKSRPAFQSFRVVRNKDESLWK